MYHVVTMGDVAPGVSPVRVGSTGRIDDALDLFGLGRPEALAAGLVLGALLGAAAVLAFRR